MELLDSLRWRYATKQFDPEKSLTDDQVNGLLEAANLSATSFGLQPFKFVVIRNQELQDRLVPCSWNQAQVSQASHVIVIAVRTNVDEAYVKQYLELMESERSLPSGSLNGYKEMIDGFFANLKGDEMLNWASKQAYIALGTLLTACATEKIDACPMEGFVASEYNEILGLNEKNLHATVVIPIGYRAEEDKHQTFKKVRWPLSDIVENL